MGSHQDMRLPGIETCCIGPLAAILVFIVTDQIIHVLTRGPFPPAVTIG